MTKSRKRPVAAEPLQPKKSKSIDLPFLLMVAILCMMGIVMVFSASYASAYYKYGNSYYFVQDQLIWLILGVIVMFVMAFMSTPKFLKVIAIPSLVVAVGLLALVPLRSAG